MNLVKFYLKKIYRNKFTMYFRNILGIRPAIFLLNLSKKNISASDAFFWRTDNGFRTIFKFTNIIKFYYGKEEKNLRIIFFDKNNNLIKEIYVHGNSFNEIVIDEKFLNNIQSHGVFYVFHNSKSFLNGVIRNSCYTGYSFKNSLPSFVHGNTIAAEQNLNSMKINYGLGGFSYFKKFTYTVQNYFDYEKTEIMLVNPTNKKLNVNVNEIDIKLDKGCSIIVDTTKNKLIKIKSNCFLLRPVVFTYKKSYFDVYHG